MTALPSFGQRLRHLRRSCGFKQARVAEMGGVTQATVSRWETGEITPAPELAAFILRSFGSSGDVALGRLVRSSTLAVHLITDGDHRLIAASPSREREWGTCAKQLAGRSLWPFAPASIVEAEDKLRDSGWWEVANPMPVNVMVTASPGEINIAGGPMLWERIWLADGTAARLCTTSI